MFKKLILFFIQVCYNTGSEKEEVYKNLENVLKECNYFDKGCASNIYSFQTSNGKNLAVKKFHDQKRSRNEINFLLSIARDNISVIPKYYDLNIDQSIIIMDKLDMTLRAYLKKIGNGKNNQKIILNKLLKALYKLHNNRIVHGDLHLDNVMVKDGEIFFIDFDQSFISEDFSMDFLRLRSHILSFIDGWEYMAKDNPEIFNVINNAYLSTMTNFVFNIASKFQTPSIQYKILFVFYRLTDLTQLNSQYLQLLEAIQ